MLMDFDASIKIRIEEMPIIISDADKNTHTLLDIGYVCLVMLFSHAIHSVTV